MFCRHPFPNEKAKQGCPCVKMTRQVRGRQKITPTLSLLWPPLPCSMNGRNASHLGNSPALSPRLKKELFPMKPWAPMASRATKGTPTPLLVQTWALEGKKPLPQPPASRSSPGPGSAGTTHDSPTCANHPPQTPAPWPAGLRLFCRAGYRTISHLGRNDPSAASPTALSRGDGALVAGGLAPGPPPAVSHTDGARSPAVTSVAPQKIYFNFSGSEWAAQEINSSVAGAQEEMSKQGRLGRPRTEDGEKGQQEAGPKPHVTLPTGPLQRPGKGIHHPRNQSSLGLKQWVPRAPSAPHQKS